MSMLHNGLLGDLLGETPSTKYDVRFYQQQAMRDVLGQYQSPFGYPLGMAQFPQQGFDFNFMAAQRMSHGFEPINWKQILLNQLRAESYGRPLNEYEQFLFDSLVKDDQKR